MLIKWSRLQENMFYKPAIKYAVHLKFVEQQLESQHKNDSVFGARQLSFCSLGNLTACSSRVIRAALRSS